MEAGTARCNTILLARSTSACQRLTNTLQAVKALPHQHLCFGQRPRAQRRSVPGTCKMAEMDLGSSVGPEKQLPGSVSLSRLSLELDFVINTSIFWLTPTHACMLLMLQSLCTLSRSFLSPISVAINDFLDNRRFPFHCLIAVLFTHLQINRDKSPRRLLIKRKGKVN